MAKITKWGNVQCLAGHKMVLLAKDYNMDSYILRSGSESGSAEEARAYGVGNTRTAQRMPEESGV